MNSRLLIAMCVLIVVVALCPMADSQYFGGYGRPYNSDGYYVGGGGYGGYGGGYGGRFGGYGGYGRPYDSDGYYTD